MRYPVFLFLSLALVSVSAAAVQKPRVLALVDIGSYKPESGDTSAAQSLIRLLLYSDVIDLEGIVASSTLANGQKVRPDLVRAAISAYGIVEKNLRLHSPDFPPAKALEALVKSGQPVAGVNVRVNDSIGRQRDTEGSEWIIAAADKDDPRPLYICAFGGTADIAQALYRVREKRSEGDMLKFVSSLRIHAIGDQDATGPWLRENFPSLYYTVREAAFRGMYLGGDSQLVAPGWITSRVRSGRGFLGEIYPDFRGKDPWSPTGEKIEGVKETGSPTFLSLIPNGLNRPDRIGLSSWGGRLAGTKLRPIDSDAEPGDAKDRDPRIASVYRWRRAVQADFEARLDWCVKPVSDANHPPDARITETDKLVIKPGETLELDASGSQDRDGDKLTYEWLIDLPGANGCKIEGATSPRAKITVPPDIEPGELPVLLIVRDAGQPSLESYARLNCAVAP